MNGFLRQLAEKHSIDLIGVCSLKLLEEQKRHFSDLSQKDTAFGHAEPVHRLEYKRAWEKAEGIISFGLSYKNIIPEPPDMAERLRISMYAYGNDYHRVLKEKAEALMADFTLKYACSCKIFTDSGHLYDRMAAYSAGLGFIGRNRFLINEQFGSFIFLGHILTDIELTAEVQPAENKCRGCSRCTNSCPHGASDGKFLDYRKCISYVTQKGIHEGFDTAGYIYGCDLCQLSCPFNEDAPQTGHEEFLENADIDYAYPSFSDIMALKTDGDKYKDSALMWRGPELLRKNALAVKRFRDEKRLSSDSGKHE